MHIHRALGSGFAGIASLLCATSAMAGPEWGEFGDAGSTLLNAQKTLGVGALGGISGMLGDEQGIAGIDLEDMYLFRVLDPSSFSLSVTADFDAQLFLFNVTIPGEAFGLLANDNTISGNLPAFGNAATDGTGAMVNLPGVYALAISGTGRNPVSINGNLFNYGVPTEVSGPDGPGGLNPHNGWAGSGPVGSYTISLTGSEFYDVPAPGALALLGLAGLCRRNRRRFD